MALAGAAPSAPPPPDRNPLPANNIGDPAALSISLPSRNPFRNRQSALPSPRTPDASSRSPAAMSRNPFLDSSETSAARAPKNDVVDGLTAEIFGDMSLQDKPASNGAPMARPPRSGTMPLNNRPPPRGPPSPSRREHRPAHARRASESSMMDMDRRTRHDRDGNERPQRTESEERRRRERRKEREERHRRGKSGGKSGGKGSRPQRGLDLIDKLDVTGIYGQGLFHHDGPFDACNPHRNVRKDRRAPMQAFPADSMNMALGGSGPLNRGLDLDRIHGRGHEGFQDYATARRGDAAIFNPTDRVEQVHGTETYGLGTSTFLDGAPASRSALQRRESEDQTTTQESLGGVSAGGSGGGLARKKSLAQRLRGMSGSRRNGGPGDSFRSPEARYNSATDPDTSPPRIKAQSAGGRVRAAQFDGTRANEDNPFDSEYTAAFDKKGAQIRIAERHRDELPSSRAPAPGSPGKSGHGLVRSRTEEAQAGTSRSSGEDAGAAAGAGGGFLNRMKSLKGGPRRPKTERVGSNN